MLFEILSVDISSFMFVAEISMQVDISLAVSINDVVTENLIGHFLH